MKNIAVIAFSQLPAIRCEPNKVDVEMVAPLIHEVFKQTGMERDQIGFTWEYRLPFGDPLFVRSCT